MQKPKNKNSTRMNLTYKFSNITKILRSLHICFILPWWVFVRYQSLCFTNVPYNFGMSILVLFICFHVGFLILLCYKYTTMNHKTLHLWLFMIFFLVHYLKFRLIKIYCSQLSWCSFYGFSCTFFNSGLHTSFFNNHEPPNSMPMTVYDSFFFSLFKV